MSGTVESPELEFVFLAKVSESATARVELCRIAGGKQDGMLVAVKRPRLDATVIPQLVAMFRDETRMTSSLEHAHIVRLVCWGSDDQGPYFATEFVRGVSAARLARTVVRTGDSFPERIVAQLAILVCRGLAAAHGLCSSAGEPLNLVHRDLTPDNLLLGFDGAVKISDFGLAKTKQCTTKTVAGMVKGTCEYMAPEQVRGAPLDGRVDIFALGVVMFELLAGQRPWQGRTPADTMLQIAEKPVPSLAALRPGIHGALCALVERCLAKDRQDRFPSASALEAELSQWMVMRGHTQKQEQLACFVRRNAMRQSRWCERAIAGEFAAAHDGEPLEPPQMADETQEPGAGDPQANVPAGGAGPRGGTERAVAPTEPMPEVSDIAAVPKTMPNIRAEDADDAPTLAQSLDHAASFALSHTEPDLRLGSEETMDTGATMPSVLAQAESAGGRSGRARPIFVALPRSTPPPAGPETQSSARQASSPAETDESPVAPPAPTPVPEKKREVGARPVAMYRDAREIMAGAANLGARSDHAAREAFDAAKRARMAAEAAQDAAARAEGGARAAVLAQRAIVAIEAGDLRGGEELLEQAKELRR